MAISTNGTIITRLAGALYGEYLSNASYTEVKETAAATVAADMIKNDFAGKTDAQLAKTILTNLGLTSITGLDNWVAAQLTAAGTTATAKGAKLVEMLNGYANMTTDATYGTYATSFNAKVEASLVLSQTAGTKAGSFATADVVAVTNQTIALTADLETVTGGAGNDRFVASYGTTYDSGDSIEGGAGTDTLSVSVTGSDLVANTTVSVLANSIEKILVANTETDADHDMTFDLASAGSDIATVGTYASTATGDTSFTNVGSIVAIEAAGKGDVSVTYASGVTSGAADTQSITLNGVGTSSTSRTTITSAGIETVNLISNTSTNNVTIANSSLKTLNISGSKAATVGSASTALTKIDASSATGAITFTGATAADSFPTTDLTLIGGSGNDVLRIDGATINSNDSINAGEGVDTLQFTGTANVGSASVGAKLAGFETMYGYRYASTTDAADYTVSAVVSYVPGITKIGTNSWTVSETSTAEDDQADGVTFTGVTAAVTTLNLSGISYTSTDADAEGDLDFTAAVTLATDTGNDSLSVVLGSTTSAALTSTGGTGTSSLAVSVGDIENLTITSQGAANTVATLTAGDLQKLTITASEALTISSISGVGAGFKTVDASSSTKNVRIDTAIQGAGTVLGGAGNDTLSGSAYADSIDGGAGNDSLTSGGGNDTILGGGGDDSITNSSSTSTNKVSIDGGSGDDTITAGTGNDTIQGGEGNDVFVFAWGDAESGSEEDNDSVSTFAVLTSADVVNGGDGIDTLRVTGTVLDSDTFDLSSSALTALSGVTNIERLQWNGDNTEAGDSITVKLGDIALGSFNNDLTVTFGTAVDYAAGVDASSVYNSSSKITASAATGQAFTYTVGNGLDSATGGAASDTFNISNNVFWGANDVLKGGTGNDTLSFTDDNGGTLTSKLATMSSIETININTTDSTATARVTIVLSDAVVSANYDSSANKFTITRDDEDTGTLSVDGSTVAASYNLVLTGASGANSTTGGGDTLIGGAGNDTITGGDGNPDVITLTAGGTDSVRYTADGDGGDAVDVITGFTTYTSSGTSTAAQSGYDKIVFLADGSGENADIFNVGSAVVFANTDATETTNGVVTTLASGDYNEFAGKSTAAGTGLEDNKVNVITGRGYESIDAALDYNGVTSGDTSGGEGSVLDAASMFVVFYNSASARTELWYVEDTDSDNEDAGGAITSTSTLMAYFTDIALTGVGGFGYQNFAVESGYIS